MNEWLNEYSTLILTILLNFSTYFDQFYVCVLVIMGYCFD